MVREAEVKFTRELADTLTVKNLDASGLHIGGDRYRTTVALTPEILVADWSTKPVADLLETDFAALLETQPEIVLLGTGRQTIFAPRELTFSFARRGIGLDVMDSAAAARTFNVLASEGRRVAAIFYPL